MTYTTICVATFIEQVVANYTILVRPLLTKTGNFAYSNFMACGTVANFLGLMPLVVKFYAMLEYKNIGSK